MSQIDSTTSKKLDGSTGTGGSKEVNYVVEVKKVIGVPFRPTGMQRTELLAKNLAARAQRQLEAEKQRQLKAAKEREEAAQKRRDERKEEANAGTKLVKESQEKAKKEYKQDPFNGELENSSAAMLQAARGKSGVASVSEDQTLKAVVDGLAEVKVHVAGSQFYEAFRKLNTLSGQCATGRSEQEDKRKKSMLPDSKRIHQDRVTQYDKLKTLIDAALNQVMSTTKALEETNNELCAAVFKMNSELAKGNKDAANPWHVKNLRDFLEVGGLPDDTVATSKKLLDKATALLEQEYRDRLQGDTSPQAVANVLLDLGASGRGTSGTSEVQIIKNPNGKVAFAFKPIDGESDQNKGDTLREVVSSRMCQSFTALTNPKLDLGFPDASAVKVGGRGGALLEGINGTELPAEKGDKLSDEEKARLDQLAQNVPAKELQKVILSAMVCGDGDMKWDNVFLVDDGTKTRRFDGGKGLPDKDSRKQIFLEEIRGNSKILTSKECLLFNTPFSKKPLAAANAPMSQELVASFLSIKDKLTDLKDTMVRESQAACQALSMDGKPQSLDASAIEQTVRSIGRAVAILESKNPITTQEFYSAWAAQRVLDMASDYLADQQTAIDEFNNYDQNALTQALQGMGLKNDMAAAVQAIQRTIAGGPTAYQDAMADDIHRRFQVIDKLLAAFEFVKLDPGPELMNEFRKKSKVAPPKAEKGKTTDIDAMVKSVWDILLKLSKDEQRKFLAKLAKLSGPKLGPCERPGAGMTLKFLHAQPDRSAFVSIGVIENTMTVYLVDSKLPANLADLIKAAIV